MRGSMERRGEQMRGKGSMERKSEGMMRLESRGEEKRGEEGDQRLL